MTSSSALHISLVLFLILNFFLHTKPITCISSAVAVNGAPIANHEQNMTEVLARKRRSPPPPSPPPSIDGVDRYIFVLQWPRTTCNKYNASDVPKCIHHVPNPSRFKIHGLWPGNTRGGQLISSGKEFNRKGDVYAFWLKSLISDITDRWPDIVYGDDYGFWKHEWTDHGVFSDFDSPQEYFRTTNYLYDRFKISTLVNALRIARTPVQVGHAYDISTLTTTFKEALGVSLQITCHKNEIWEINIYLDKYLKDSKYTVLEPPSETKNCPVAGVQVTFPSPL